jgi:hypothetical protein
MLPMADPVVDWGELLNVVWTALVGGIGVTAAFAIALYGAVRATDAQRSGATVLAVGYWTLMLLAGAAVVASVAFGVIVMTSKD